MEEREIIPAEESFTGEEIEIDLYPEEVQEKIRGFQSAYTKKRQKELAEVEELKKKMQELEELKEEYYSLLKDEEFSKWVETRGKGKQTETETKIPSEIEEKISSIERKVLAKEIEDELEEVDNMARRNNLPTIDDVWEDMLEKAREIASSTPDGKCPLSPTELYYLVVGSTTTKKSPPFLEGKTQTGSTKSDYFDEVLKIRRSL